MSNELRIAYDVGTRQAKLIYAGLHKAWPPIRRLCQDTTDQTESTGTTSISMPWWAFLACRSDLDYLSRRHHFAIVADESAAAKLRAAEAVSEDYALALTADPIDEQALVAALLAAGFTRDLTPEQLRNVRRLCSWPSGATFSVPGAGKTTEALAFYAYKRTPDSRLLVVSPKNAFAAWEEQLALCLPEDSPFVRLRGGRASIEKLLKKSPGKALISYHQIPNVEDLIASYADGAAAFVFLDESHKIKRGFGGVIGNSILSMADLPRAKMILSGTPMPNDISDLVPQFRFLFPEIPAEEDDVEGYIRPVYVRTTKPELHLPKVKTTIKNIPLRPAQYELYQLLRSEAARQARHGLGLTDRMRLRRAGANAFRLLQVVSNPALLARLQFDHPALLGDVLAEGDSPKLEYACFRARELASQGNKSIIWSSFVNNVELVSNRLADLGAEYIHGGVDAGSEEEEGTREQKIKRFHEDSECYVLVANPAACGEGISLHTVCHHAIYLDRNYNAAQFLQSQDRIHRLGLAPGTLTYIEILVAPGTVDDVVHRRLQQKIANMARVLDDASLHVEPEVVDLDADGFDRGDYDAFSRHLLADRAAA